MANKHKEAWEAKRKAAEAALAAALAAGPETLAPIPPVIDLAALDATPIKLDLDPVLRSKVVDLEEQLATTSRELTAANAALEDYPRLKSRVDQLAAVEQDHARITEQLAKAEKDQIRIAELESAAGVLASARSLIAGDPDFRDQIRKLAADHPDTAGDFRRFMSTSAGRALIDPRLPSEPSRVIGHLEHVARVAFKAGRGE